MDADPDVTQAMRFHGEQVVQCDLASTFSTPGGNGTGSSGKGIGHGVGRGTARVEVDVVEQNGNGHFNLLQVAEHRDQSRLTNTTDGTDGIRQDR